MFYSFVFAGGRGEQRQPEAAGTDEVYEVAGAVGSLGLPSESCKGDRKDLPLLLRSRSGVHCGYYCLYR